MESKCNNIQTCLTNKQYADIIKIFKAKGHDLATEPLSKIYREEIIIPYIKKELKND